MLIDFLSDGSVAPLEVRGAPPRSGTAPRGPASELEGMVAQDGAQLRRVIDRLAAQEEPRPSLLTEELGVVTLHRDGLLRGLGDESRGVIDALLDELLFLGIPANEAPARFREAALASLPDLEEAVAEYVALYADLVDRPADHRTIDLLAKSDEGGAMVVAAAVLSHAVPGDDDAERGTWTERARRDALRRCMKTRSSIAPPRAA